MSNQTSMNILHENTFGHVARCSCCDDIQLNLGTIIFHLSVKEYVEFDTFFNEIRKDLFSCKSNELNTGKYIIRTNHNNMILSFSYQELKDTIELLNFSNIMLSVNDLTQMN